MKKLVLNKAIALIAVYTTSFSWNLMAQDSTVTYIDYKTTSFGLNLQYQLDPVKQAEHLKIKEETKQFIKDAAEPAKVGSMISKYFSKKPMSFPKLSDGEKYSAIGELLNQRKSYRDSKNLKKDMTQILGDLEFFSNVNNVSDRTFFKVIDRTRTSFGKVVFASMLANPLTKIDELEERRQFLIALSKSTLAPQIEHELNEISRIEDLILNLWAQDPALMEAVFKIIGDGKNLNKTIFYNNFKEFGTLLEAWTIVVAYPLFFYQAGIPMGAVIFVPIMLTMTELNVWGPDRKRRELIRYIHDYTIAVNSLFSHTRTLNRLVSQIPHAEKVLKHFSLISRIEEKAVNLDTPFTQVYNNMKATPSRYYGKGAYWTVYASQVQNTFSKLRESQEDFAELFEAVGEIDSYMSICQLVKEHEGSETTISFASFVSGGKSPTLKLEGFWNIMLPRASAVANDLNMGEGFNGMLLTGSNTGGKSTLLKGIASNLLLAQGLGIVSARHAELTPVNVILSSLNVTDDISKGSSLFQSEVNRAKMITKTASSLGPNEYGFILLDELFTGTAAEQGAAAAKKVASKLFQTSNVVTIFATHYKEITELGAGTFENIKNFKIDAIKKEDGTFIRNFKLESGVSSINIANEILNMNIDDIEF